MPIGACVGLWHPLPALTHLEWCVGYFKTPVAHPAAETRSMNSVLEDGVAVQSKAGV